MHGQAFLHIFRDRPGDALRLFCLKTLIVLIRRCDKSIQPSLKVSLLKRPSRVQSTVNIHCMALIAGLAKQQLAPVGLDEG